MEINGINEEYVAFIAALPPDLELDLRSAHVQAAFLQARTAGHSAANLTYDAQSRVRGGAGVGALVEALRTLAKNPPVARRQAPHPGERTITRLPAPHAFVADKEGWFCQVCQLPVANRTHQGFQPIPYTASALAASVPTLSTDQVNERMALLERIRVEHLTPDEAEEAMRELIAEQRGGR